MGRNLRWCLSVISVISAIAINGFGRITPIQAAETVIIRRSGAAQAIDVADLNTIAQTGEIPPSLDAYVKSLRSEQRQHLLALLSTNFTLNPTTVRELLETEIGDRLITELTTVISGPSLLEAYYIKTAFLQAAASPQGLSVLSFIEAYPEPVLDINLQQAAQVVSNFNRAFWRTQAFMAELSPLLIPQNVQLELPFDPTQAGDAQVEVISLSLSDQQRGRDIPLDIYVSQASSPEKPVIIFSHGLGSVNTDLRYLANHLASYGYVVAALEHPGSNEAHVRSVLGIDAPLALVLDTEDFFKRLLSAEEFLERPRDISFVLDELEKLNRSPGQLQGKLASDKALVVGYSLGGSTALSLAGAPLQLTELKQRCPGDILEYSLGENAQCFARDLPGDRYQLRDPRIQAAIALSPTTSLLFGETGLTEVDVPTLILAASADKTTPVLTEQIIAFEQLPQPKWLAGVIGATHLSVKDPSTTMDQAGQPDTLYTGGEIVGQEAVAVRDYLKAITLAMAAQLTNQADDYAIFLTPAYAQYASTDDFQFRMATEIPQQAQEIINRFLSTP